jgi:hypothetical protein
MDLTPFVNKLTILDKNVNLVHLQPNWAQADYLARIEDQFRSKGSCRIIILKARQLGMSTITEALAYSMSFIMENYRSLIIAHEVDAARNLLKMTKRFHQYSPWSDYYTLKHDTRNDMEWVENGSSIKVATAGKKGDAGVGRSSTNHFIHASEVAFWDEAETVWNGLSQTIPRTRGTFICFESTANGTGNFFHHMWEDAEAGENEYVPLFYPWWKHPEYTATEANLPVYALGHLDEDEEMLKNLMYAEGLRDELAERIIWRRWAVKNLCNANVLQFQQEYPATAEEAFIASGLNVFPQDKLKACYERAPGLNGFLFRNGEEITFKADPHGPMKIFKKPSVDGAYVVGGDPTRTTRGDFACAQIINRYTLEQVGIWRGKTSPGTFAEELYKIGTYFNGALIVPEIEGPGHMTVGQLIGMNYPNIFRRKKVDRTTHPNVPTYGWSTTAHNKELAIGWLLQNIVNKDLLIHDHHTYMEMRDYVTQDSGGYGPADEKHGHDDTVMSMAIAITGHKMSGPPPDNTSELPSILRQMNNSSPSDPYAYPGEDNA